MGPSLPPPTAGDGQVPDAGTDHVAAEDEPQDPTRSDDALAAAQVLLDMLKGKRGEIAGKDGDVGNRLSSSLWTDLLD